MGSATQRSPVEDLKLPLTATQKRQAFANMRKVKSSGKSSEENKDPIILGGSDEAVAIPLIYDFTSKYMEFSWDPENSSKEVQFSYDYRQVFLGEANYYFRTVISNRPFMEGVHYWEIIADARTEHELKIGVTTQQKFNVNASFSDYDFGYAYYGLG